MIRTIPALAVSMLFTSSVVGQIKPEIVKVYGTYFEGPTDGTARHVYYLDSVNVDEQITVKVNWNGLAPDCVEFKYGSMSDCVAVSPPSDPTDPDYTTETSKTFHMADFAAGDKLTVTAITRDQDNPPVEVPDSDPADAFFTVVHHPIGVIPANMQHDTNSTDELHYSGILQFSSDSISGGIAGGTLEGEIPAFGDGPIGTLLDIAPDTDIWGDGSAKFAFEFEPGGDDEGKDSSISGVDYGFSITAAGTWKYNDGWGLDNASVGASAELSVAVPNPPYQFLVIVGPFAIPCYIDGWVKLSADATLGLEDFLGEGLPSFNGCFGVEPGAEVMLGVGFKKLKVFLEAFFGGGVRLEFDYAGGCSSDVQDDWDLIVFMYGGFRASAWIFKYERKGLECTYSVSTGVAQCTGPGGRGDTGFEPIPRDYLNAPGHTGTLDTTPVAHNVLGIPGTTKETLVTAGFPYSTPSLVTVGNDILLAWIEDDENRPDNDRTVAMFSRLAGGESQWTAQERIPHKADGSDDGTGDYNVHLSAFPPSTFPDGRAFAAWETTRSSNGSAVDPNDLVDNMEIAVSEYVNGTWSAQQFITDNNQGDEVPIVDTASNGTAMLTWLQREQTSDFVTTPLRAFKSMYFNGSSWQDRSGQSFPSSGHEIIAYDMAYQGTTAMAVFEVDTDGNTTTLTDREIYLSFYNGSYWNNPAPLTTNTVEDRNPQILDDETGFVGDFVVIWYQGYLGTVEETFGRLVQQSFQGDIPVSSIDVAVSIPGPSSRLADFKLIEGGTAQWLLVWQWPSDSLVDLQYVLLDPFFGEYSDIKSLTNDLSMEHSVTGAFNLSGQVVLAFDDVAVIRRGDQTIGVDGNDVTIPSVPETGTTDLVLLRHNIQPPDIAVREGSLRLTSPQPGSGESFTLEGVIENLGDTTEEIVDIETVAVPHGTNGTVAGSVPLCDSVLLNHVRGGASVKVAPTNCLALATTAPTDVQMIAYPVSDPNPNNDTQSAALILPDLRIARMWVTQPSTCTREVHLIVENAGTAVAESANVVVHAGGGTGLEIASITVPQLDPGSSFSNVIAQAFRPNLAVDGLVEIVATVEPSSGVPEFREDNNTRSVLVNGNIFGGDDSNGNGIADECEGSQAVTVHTGPDLGSRYVRFEAPSSWDSGEEAIRVKLLSLDGYTVPEPGYLWVGAPYDAPDGNTSIPGNTFRVAPLSCEPVFYTFSAEGELAVYGTEIIPLSTYAIQRVPASCADLTNELCYSPEVVATTGTYGDCRPPYAGSGSAQPDFSDISGVVDKFLSAPDAPVKALAQLQPALVSPDRPIDFNDIAAAVDSFLGQVYSSQGFAAAPCTCPSSVTCGVTSCFSNANCPGGLCVGSFCADPCGRCAP